MEIRNRDLTSLGLLLVVAAALFVAGFFFLMGAAPWEGGLRVTLLTEDGGGLNRGSPVHLHGVSVGSVGGVQLERDGGVSVRLNLDRGLRLPADTRAAVRSDVFGSRAVELLPGTSLVALQPGDTIRGAAVPALTDLATEVGAQAKVLLGRADTLVSSQAMADLHATAAVLPMSAEELLGAFVELRQAAAAVRRSAEELEDQHAGPALASTLQQLEVGARSLSTAADAMERSFDSLSSILSKVDRGDGTLGRLVNDSSIYLELQDVLTEVRSLAADMRAHPQRYIQLRIF